MKKILILLLSILFLPSCYHNGKNNLEQLEYIKYEDAGYTLISLDEVEAKIAAKDSFVLYFGSSSCPVCNNFSKTLKEYNEKKSQRIYHLSGDDIFTAEQKTRIEQLASNLIPAITLFVKGEIVHKSSGDMSLASFTSLLNKYYVTAPQEIDYKQLGNLMNDKKTFFLLINDTVEEYQLFSQVVFNNTLRYHNNKIYKLHTIDIEELENVGLDYYDMPTLYYYAKGRKETEFQFLDDNYHLPLNFIYYKAFEEVEEVDGRREKISYPEIKATNKSLNGGVYKNVEAKQKAMLKNAGKEYRKWINKYI